jgi:hypothetical protein
MRIEYAGAVSSVQELVGEHILANTGGRAQELEIGATAGATFYAHILSYFD